MDMNQANEHVVTTIASDEITSTPENQEKLLPQSQVNKIVQHEKARAAAAARQEVEEKYQREASLQTHQQANQTNNVNANVDVDALAKQVRDKVVADQREESDKLNAQQREEQASNLVNMYFSKMAQGKETYADFEEVTKDFDPAAFPQLAALSAQLDNTADIIYELAANPSKLVTLDTLANRNPRQGQAELLKLSKSIASNKQAQTDADSRYTPAPLARLQPSKVSGSNGKLGIRDLRSQDWLKG